MMCGGGRIGADDRRFSQLKLMEAFMYRHHPQWQTAKSATAASDAAGTYTFPTSTMTQPTSGNIARTLVLDIGLMRLAVAMVVRRRARNKSSAPYRSKISN